MPDFPDRQMYSLCTMLLGNLRYIHHFSLGVWIVNMISEILFDNDVVFLPSGLAVSPVKRQFYPY